MLPFLKCGNLCFEVRAKEFNFLAGLSDLLVEMGDLVTLIAGGSLDLVEVLLEADVVMLKLLDRDLERGHAVVQCQIGFRVVDFQLCADLRGQVGFESRFELMDAVRPRGRGLFLARDQRWKSLECQRRCPG